MSHTALHMCSDFDLDDLLLNLEKGNLSVNAGPNIGPTPIIKAASKGHVSTVRQLRRSRHKVTGLQGIWTLGTPQYTI
jgi:hypothetical protein